MEYIDSGSTLLNLALTRKADGGWPIGRISNVVGDSSTGKTMLATEAAMSLLDNSPKGVKPRVVYYETEAAFDMEYASKVGLDTQRVEFMQGLTIEKFKDDMEKVLDEMIKDGKGRGLIILDSLDSISSDDELKAGISGGTYGMSKAKKLGQIFRELLVKLNAANVHLMIISQVRQNIGGGLYAPKYIRSGGKALEFASTHVVWLANMGKDVCSKTKLARGWKIEARTTKNKHAEPLRPVLLNFLYGTGIDDVQSLITFCADPTINGGNGIEKAGTGRMTWPGEDKGYFMDDLIERMQSDGEKYKQLIEMAVRFWEEREEKTKVVRKKRGDFLKGQ